MAELSAGQATQVARLIEEALHVYGSTQDSAIAEMREGAIAIINFKIDEAEDMRATLEKQMVPRRVARSCSRRSLMARPGQPRTLII